MAKCSVKVSYSNAVITKEGSDYFAEEFNSKGESTGKFNLSSKLDEILNIEGAKLSFDTTEELGSDV